MDDNWIKLSDASHSIVCEALTLRTRDLLAKIAELKNDRRFIERTIEKETFRSEASMERLKGNLQSIEGTIAERERQLKETQDTYAIVKRAKYEYPA